MEHILNIPPYTKSAVYALVDDRGKKYIGSTNNLNRRIKSHDREMRTVLSGKNSGFLSNSMTDAVLSGRTFHVEILAAYDFIDRDELTKIEKACVIAAGGPGKTYNARFPARNKSRWDTRNDCWKAK